MSMEHINDWHWLDLDEVGSTNDEAIRLSSAPPMDKFVVTAIKQVKGRGRRGRDWVGLDGNLFASFGIKIEARYIGILSFIISLAVLDTIKELDARADVKIKWPNDVLLNDKKVTGILIEKGSNDYFIAGVGVNIVDHPRNINLIYEASDLKSNDIQTDRITFLNKYIKRLNGYLSDFSRNGFVNIKDKWLENVKNLGQEIIVKFEDSEKRGIFKGTDDNGYLLLDMGSSIEKIYAGDVFYI